MDGVSFDYFGIGQFWFCLSEANDFGIQARFFYYGQTSFTGAVAVKIASSVLTLTTPPGGPVLRCVSLQIIETNIQMLSLNYLNNFRIDGSVVDSTLASNLTFDDNSVVVDVIPNTNQPDSSAVVIVNVQFKNG